jgi:ABC-type phosphate transport system auxiliary subunit
VTNVAVVPKFGWKTSCIAGDFEIIIKVKRHQDQLPAGPGELQEEFWKDISASEDKLRQKLKKNISAIQAGQSEFEETITDMLDTQSKGVMEIV